MGRCLARSRPVWVSVTLAGLLLLYGTSLYSRSRRPGQPLSGTAWTASRRAPAWSADVAEDGGAAEPNRSTLTGGQQPRVVLYWNRLFYDRDFRLGFGSAPFQGCPVSNCVATNDRSQFPIASGVLIHARNVDERDLPEKDRRPEQKYIFVNQEPPFLTWINLNHLNGFFNLSMTYNRDADIYFPYAETARGEQKETLPDFNGRAAAAAWMVSHCETHSQREKYVDKLRQHIPVRIIGGCGPEKCDAPTHECYWRMAADNLFYVAFENSLCDDYITEKFWLALQFGLVPVVRGASPEAYRRVAPPHSFIHVQEFAGPAALAAYLHRLAGNETAYNEYHSWRGSHRVQDRRSACDLCAELWKSPGVSRQLRISKLWSQRRLCRWADDLPPASFIDHLFRLKSRLVRRRQSELAAAVNRSRSLSSMAPPPLLRAPQTDNGT